MMNNFISEKELKENREQRQKEWEKVRSPEDPKEAPEVPFDSRSLFERLQEQKDNKQQEFEEALKFKNQFRGVNKDEAAFLDDVAQQVLNVEKLRNDEVNKELEVFRKAQTEQMHQRDLKSSSVDPKTEQKCGSKRKNLQAQILTKAVKIKRNAVPSIDACGSTSEKLQTDDDVEKSNVVLFPPARTCVAYLPGIGCYSDDSDSSPVITNTSDSESTT